MEQMLEIYLQYEAITESQRETIREQQELINRLTIENINLKQIISEAAYLYAAFKMKEKNKNEIFER